MNLKIIRRKHFLLDFHLRDKIQVFLQLILKNLTSDIFYGWALDLAHKQSYLLDEIKWCIHFFCSFKLIGSFEILQFQKIIASTISLTNPSLAFGFLSCLFLIANKTMKTKKVALWMQENKINFSFSTTINVNLMK